MNDPVNRLEAELAAMPPTPISRELTDRIEAQLRVETARVSPWPDRFLLSAICSGAAAACVILALLFNDGQSVRSARPLEIATANARGFDTHLLAVSVADGRWADILK